jgi:hypothetical protein
MGFHVKSKKRKERERENKRKLCIKFSDSREEASVSTDCQNYKFITLEMAKG